MVGSRSPSMGQLADHIQVGDLEYEAGHIGLVGWCAGLGVQRAGLGGLPGNSLGGKDQTGELGL